MKKFLVPLVITLFAFVGVVQAEQIQTEFSAPLRKLNLDTNEWSVLYKDKSVIVFDHNEDSDVGFFVFQGLPLKKASHSELVKQISKAKGIVKKIPLLVASFPFIKDEVKILGIKNWSEVIVNGKKGIKSYELFDERDESSLEDGEIEESVMGYLFLLGNRIFLISFKSPKETFLDLEPLFEETIQNLW
jgi:hypothetical protein